MIIKIKIKLENDIIKINKHINECNANTNGDVSQNWKKWIEMFKPIK